MKLYMLFLCPALTGLLIAAEAPKFDYRLLATTRTSTMEKEMNEAAGAGYKFADVVGGESAFGGKEVLVIMTKPSPEPPGEERRSYKLLATSRTGTLEKELKQAGEDGYDFCGQTVFESLMGGKEVSVILEKNPNLPRKIEYKLLAASRTSTLEKELKEAGGAGYEFLELVIGKTAFGGKEGIAILRRYAD